MGGEFGSWGHRAPPLGLVIFGLVTTRCLAEELHRWERSHGLGSMSRMSAAGIDMGGTERIRLVRRDRWAGCGGPAPLTRRAGPSGLPFFFYPTDLVLRGPLEASLFLIWQEEEVGGAGWLLGGYGVSWDEGVAHPVEARNWGGYSTSALDFEVNGIGGMAGGRNNRTRRKRESGFSQETRSDPRASREEGTSTKVKNIPLQT